jgi:prepilin-type N-terminal cleavage/methylation domain-containing protein
MHRRRGMTLIELLLVVFILATLAASASSLIDGAHEQARHDDNLVRRELLRRAIVGSDEQGAAASGYVADVGALPPTLAHLLQPIGVASHTIRDFEVGSGWRGPYMRSTPRLSNGALEFPDGWGNPETTPGNFGWSVVGAGTDLVVTSLGSDGQPGGVGYAADISMTIRRDEHHVNLNDWSLDLHVRLTGSGVADVTTSLVLRAWVPDPVTGLRSVDGVAATHTIYRAPSDPVIATPITLSFPATDSWVPQGIRAIELCNLASGEVVSLPTRQYALVDLRANAARPTHITRRFIVQDP